MEKQSLLKKILTNLFYAILLDANVYGNIKMTVFVNVTNFVCENTF